MKVQLNGTFREVAEGTTLEDLLEFFGLKRESVAIELNREVVGKELYSARRIAENDTIEIVRFVGGG